VAQAIVNTADQACPYSKAIRGKVPVALICVHMACPVRISPVDRARMIRTNKDGTSI
jgi:hypothetical protein